MRVFFKYAINQEERSQANCLASFFLVSISYTKLNLVLQAEEY